MSQHEATANERGTSELELDSERATFSLTADQTVPIGVPAGADTVFNPGGALTARLARTGGLTASPPTVPTAHEATAYQPGDPGDSANASTVSFDTGATVALAAPIIPSANGSLGSPASAAVTAPVSPIATTSIESPATPDDDAIAELQRSVEAHPGDPDALFKLAVLQHRVGRVAEARGTLSSLARAYEVHGQSSQADRIRRMLGTPPPESPSENGHAPGGSTTLIEPPAATAPLKRTGALLRTEGVRQTGPLGRTSRGETSAAPLTPTFEPKALTFTIPLPGEDERPVALQAAINDSTVDLQAGRLDAALDACIHGLRIDDTYLPLSVRIAEIYAAQRHKRRARAHAECLLRLLKITDDTEHLWMVYRVLLHTTDNDLVSLRRLVELLIEAGQTEHASYYAAQLIQLLDREGLTDEALAYSVRLCKLIPGDTRATLENAILRLKGGDPDGAMDRWEAAVAAGADPTIGKASLAAVMTSFSEEDYWRTLASVTQSVREGADDTIVDAYARTSAVMAPSAILTAGLGLLLALIRHKNAPRVLASAVGDRQGAPFARAVSAVALAQILREQGPADEHVAAVRTSLKLLADPAIANHPLWMPLVGVMPRFEDLSLELGEALLERQDAAGAAEVLKAAHERAPRHDQICQQLAEAFFRTGQLGAALTTLDGLAAHHRATGQLEAMAAVLRRMSQLAPNNIKVKSRLIDTYLQRGFVAEARAELIQRADLEERSGLIQGAVKSLERACDLSWTSGLAEETFALYKRIILLAPEVVDHRHALVTLYLQMGRLTEAAEHQRAIVDISLREDRKHEAIAALHQVIGLTPDDTTAYYQLAELLGSIGEYRQAERVYRRVLAIAPDDAIAQAKATAMASLHERAARDHAQPAPPRSRQSS